MSLDVYLKGAACSSPRSGIFIREDGAMREISRAEWDARHPGREPVVSLVERAGGYHANITHNLMPMAQAAGIDRPLWEPDQVGISKASDLVLPLSAGLARLCDDPERFRRLNPSNGWGSYEGLLRFVSGYLGACIRNPDSAVSVSR